MTVSAGMAFRPCVAFAGHAREFLILSSRMKLYYKLYRMSSLQKFYDGFDI